MFNDDDKMVKETDAFAFSNILLTVLKETNAPDDGVTLKTDTLNNSDLAFEKTNPCNNYCKLPKQVDASRDDVVRHAGWVGRRSVSG